MDDTILDDSLEIEVSGNFQSISIKNNLYETNQSIPLSYSSQMDKRAYYKGENAFFSLDRYGNGTYAEDMFYLSYKGYNMVGEHDSVAIERVAYQQKKSMIYANDGPVLLAEIEYTKSLAKEQSREADALQEILESKITIYDTTNEITYIVETNGNKTSSYPHGNERPEYVYDPIVTSVKSRAMTEEDKEAAKALQQNINTQINQAQEILKEKYDTKEEEQTVPTDKRGGFLHDEKLHESIRGLADVEMRDGATVNNIQAGQKASHHIG